MRPALSRLDLVCVFALALASAVHGAELRRETVSAWDRYVHSADAAMQARLRPGNPFLWADEASARRGRLRAGEILVTGVGGPNPKQVPSGMIHHWIGAAFFPNATLNDVLGVVRNYAHYKDYYNPNVIDSRAIWRTPAADRFSTLLVSKALSVKIAIENECESLYVQTGPGRLYSLATTVRIQEIEDYGQLSERKLPSGEGSGYVWSLHTITRYEQADGGVYVEVEAMALSRDILPALRWMADPVVRRISKTAMATSLRQMQDAVGSRGQIASAPPVTTRVTSPRLVSEFLQSSPRHR